MKKLSILFALLIAFTFSQAQTQTNLPAGSKPYSGNLFRDLSGNIWTGYAGSYTNLGTKFKMDSLLMGKVDTAALGNFYNKSQVDAFLLLKVNLDKVVTDLNDPDDLTIPTTKAVADAIAAIPPTDLSNYYDKQETDDLLDTKIDTALLEKPNGVPLLDINGKIKMVNIPDQLIGAVNYQGTWSPATNTPTLPAVPGPETKGHYYVASDSASFQGVVYRPNDWIISSGSEWQIIEATNYVRRVNGKTGDVVLTAADIGAEVTANKATNFTTLNNTLYPTTQAVANYVASQTPAAQTLSQPSIGQIAISSGNTINLNTVNTSGIQAGIAGNKEWIGLQTIARGGTPLLTLSRTNSGANSVIKYTTTSGDLYAGHGTFGAFQVGNNSSLTSGNFFSVSATETKVSSLSGVGNRMVIASSTGTLSTQVIPTANDGTLSLATGTGLTGSASFSANQSGNATFTVEAASGYAIPTTAQSANWTTAYDYSEIGHIPLSQKGANNGVATLNAGGVIPWEQLPTSNPYKGTWDASSNTPTITDGTGTAGDYYRVNEAGTQDLGSGNITFVVGDDVIYSGTVWQRVPGGAIASNLGIGDHDGSTLQITNSNGTGLTIPAATSMLSGLMSAADKTLIGTAVQPGDDISDLTNDAGFIATGTGDAQVRSNLDLDARYAQLSGATFTGPVLWSTAPTLGGHLTNKTYVDGAISDAISGLPVGLELGETETTAYRGDRGKAAYDYSQIGHLELAGGTVTGQIKRDADAVAGDDLPRLSQVEALIGEIPPLPGMELSELNTGTDTANRSIAAKTLTDWLAAKNFVPVGANLTLLNNNAGFISVGTGDEQVRKNEDLDARYAQFSDIPDVPEWVMSIAESDIVSWNNKVTTVAVQQGIKNLGTAAAPDLAIDSVKLDQIETIQPGELIGRGGGKTNTWTEAATPSGSPGTWPATFRGTWSPSTTYDNLDGVVYGDILYYSVGGSNVNRPPTDHPTWWTAYPSIVVRGYWGPSVSYDTNDYVYFQNNNKWYRTSAPISVVSPTDPSSSAVPGPPVRITVGEGLYMGDDNILRAAGSNSISGLVVAGSNMTRTGSGTTSDPYVFSATTGGSGSVTLIPGTNIGITGNGSIGYTITNTYTLPTSTDSQLGGIKIGSNTIQTIGANAVSAVSDRTYAVQLNSAGQAVVNVPWEGGGGGGGGIAQLSGDVTTPGSGSGVSTIANGAVTNTKLANMAANTIKGRIGSSGAPQDLTEFQVRGMINKTYNLSGTTIDVANGNKQQVSRSSSATYSFSNFPAGYELQVEIENTSGATITISFDGGSLPQGSDGTIGAGRTAVFSMTKFGLLSPIRVTKVIY